MVTRIRLCPDLNAVCRLVGRDSRYRMAMRRLRNTKTREHHLVLSAPATAALMLDEANIPWPEDRPLRIALHEPGTYEFLDEGQWFRFLPAMVGRSDAIELVAYGVKAERLRSSTVTKILNQRASIRVTSSTEPVWCSGTADDLPVDITIAFAGITGGTLLLRQLVAMRNGQCPFYLTSFSSTHALLNHAILRAHGATAEPVLARNPFALVSKRAGENWNRVISKVPVESLPDASAAIDTEYLDALQVPAAMVYQSHRLGDPSQVWPVGGVVDDTVVHTMDGVAINLSTRDVIDLNQQSVLGTLSERFTEVVVDYDDGWDETDKLFWASHIRFFAMQEGMTINPDTGGAAA